MKIKYHVVFADSAEMEIDFFVKTLHFEFVRSITISSGSEITLLKPIDTDQLLAVTEFSCYRNFKSITVLQSTDCLGDYFAIKKSGAALITGPQYSSSGLTAEFADGYGNLFILLEERDYHLHHK